MTRFVLVMCAILVLAGPVQAEPTVASAVQAALQSQSAAWNRGDLETFMQTYLNSPDVLFTSGGNIIRGYDAMQARYDKRYGHDKKSMGHLRFDHLEIQALGDAHALAVGRWYLTRDGKPPMDGVFSLVWRKSADGWKIIHDHTSLRDPKS